MNPGKLNRRIVLQSRSYSKDATGAGVETWATLATVWAELLTQSQRESLVADADRNTDDSTFRIRWRSGLTSEGLRVSYGGRYYNVTGITEEGIKNGLLLECQAIRNLEV